MMRDFNEIALQSFYMNCKVSCGFVRDDVNLFFFLLLYVI